MDDSQKPLRSKVLAVPKYRTQYLQNLTTLAESLKWKTLGPFITSQAKLIGPSVKAETRSLTTHQLFLEATSSAGEQRADEQRNEEQRNEERRNEERRPGPPRVSLKDFLDGRHQFLVDYEPEAGK